MKKNRRDFLRNMGILGASVCIPGFFGCEGGDKVEPSPRPKPDPIPDPILTPFQKYNLSVDSPPNRKALFETVRGVSDSQGILKFMGSKGTESFFVSNRNAEKLSGMKGNYFYNHLNGVRMIVVEDAERKYFPNLFFPYGTGTKNGSIVTLDKKIDGKGIMGTWAKKFDDSLPSWNWEKVDDKPGSIYLGDWTFDEIRNFNTTLKNGSLIITSTIPNTITATAYTALSTAGDVLNGIDDLISIVNYLSPGTIDKNKRYAWYQPIPFVPFVSLFEPAGELLKYKTEDIKEFFPSEIGNSWKYLMGNNLYEMKINGLRNVKGKDLFVSKGVDGIEEYLGFSGNTLNHYGFNLTGIGDVFFDPPISFGDSQIQKGKTYSSNSKIVCENYPNLVGNVQESFFYENREVVSPMNKPYGGCFKIKEKTNLQLTNGSQTVNDGGTFYHWHAKNIGRVQSEINSTILPLYEFNFANLKSVGNFNNLERKVSTSGVVAEAIKKLL